MHTTIPPVDEFTMFSSDDIFNGSPDNFHTYPPFAKTDENNIHNVDHVDLDPFPDILVLGFQELDLSAEALIYSTNASREDAWCRAVFAALGDKALLYDKLVSKQLVGMLIIVVVKKSLSSCFDDIRTTAAGAGILGLMGNKGGTAVQMTFKPPMSNSGFEPGPTTLTFVNTHLAAFDEMFEKRNADFQDLSKRLYFSTVESASLISTRNVYESDILFWMGDLNYRIDLSDSDVRTILNSEDPEYDMGILLNFDQLRKAMQKKMAFAGFCEHPITYFPTYRFQHTTVIDRLGYDTRRKPAWTDRILYMSGPNVAIQQLAYKSCRQISMSDHKPVSADFFVDVGSFDKNLHHAIARDLLRSVDDAPRSHRPQIQLESTSVELGNISFECIVSQRICLANRERVPCAFRFVPRDSGSVACPEWLRIEPMHAFMIPNETIDIKIAANVDGHTASKLNLSERDLTTTLILRCITGRDHFITVTANYQPTCLANSLSILAQLPGPIRSINYSVLAGLGDCHPANAPREVMRLINWLMSADTRKLGCGLFSQSGDDKIMYTLRECLDTGDEFPYPTQEYDPKVAIAFAATLLLLFSLLPEPIIPEHLYSRCVQVTSRDDAFALLDDFPPVSVNVWISLTAFLHYICSSSDKASAKTKAKRIATILSPVLLRDSPVSFPPVSPLGKRDFLLYFIA